MVLLRLRQSYSALLFAFIGSIPKIVFGVLTKPWQTAPDQFAWEYILDQGKLSYDHLIYYPHEGGSIIISLMTLVVKILSSNHSLAITALILDFCVRYVQLRVVKNLFNHTIFLSFAIWTILSSPTLLPWGTVNFGLHYISSVFPFVLLLLSHNLKRNARFMSMSIGALLGLIIWFSYSNIPVVLLLLLFLIITTRSFNWRLFTGFTSTIVIHLLVRLAFSSGFEIEQSSITSLRGETFNLLAVNYAERLKELPLVLVKSISSQPIYYQFNSAFNVFFGAFILLGIVGFVKYYRSSKEKAISVLMPTMIGAFLAVYMASPFFYQEENGNFVSYRHLSYIIPLLVLFICVGISQLKQAGILFINFFFVTTCAVGVAFIGSPTINHDLIQRGTGWCLGRKFGHQPENLVPILIQHHDIHKQLAQGIGWGISTAISNKHLPADSTVSLAVSYYSNFPSNYQLDLVEGYKYAINLDYPTSEKKEMLQKFNHLWEVHNTHQE